MSPVGPLAVRNQSQSLLLVTAVRAPRFFIGFVGVRTRNALDTFEWIEQTALISSATFLCFIFLLPSNFRLASLACWFIKSSVIFAYGVFGLLLAKTCKSAFLSALVPNLAKSEFLMVTSRFPGFFSMAVYASDFITDDPCARTS